MGSKKLPKSQGKGRTSSGDRGRSCCGPIKSQAGSLSPFRFQTVGQEISLFQVGDMSNSGTVSYGWGWGGWESGSHSTELAPGVSALCLELLPEKGASLEGWQPPQSEPIRLPVLGWSATFLYPSVFSCRFLCRNITTYWNSAQLSRVCWELTFSWNFLWSLQVILTLG